MKTIEILMGVVGAGKSTLAKTLAETQNAVILASDEIRKEYIRAGIIPKEYDSKDNHIVFSEMHKRIEKFAKEGKSIIVDSTNIPASSRKPIIDIAQKYCYKVSGRVLLLDDEKCIERVIYRQTHERDSHYISNPREAVGIYKDRLIHGWPSLEEGFDQIITYEDGKEIKKEQKIVIATTNSGKIAIYSDILTELGLPYTSLKQLKVDLEVEETGQSEEENALIKAKAYHQELGLPVLVNDSGLIIEKFSPEDQPGVFVHRYGGGELTDEEMIKIYSEKLKKVGGESNSYFKVALALCDYDSEFHIKTFKSYRLMVAKPSKVIQKGLPLRSLYYNEELGKYWSEMTIHEANKAEGECIEGQKNFIREIFLK